MLNFYRRLCIITKTCLTSDLYIVFVSLICLSAWAFGYYTASICFLLALSAVGLVLTSDIKHFICVLILYTVSMGDPDIGLSEVIALIIFGVIAFMALIFNIVRFKKSFAPIAPAKIKGFLFAEILLIVPFLLAGIGNPADNRTITFAVAAVYALIVLISALVYVAAKGSDGSDFAHYVLKAVLALSLVASVEFIISMTQYDSVEALAETLKMKSSWIGWAGPNTFASVISMGVPCAFYFCVNKTKRSLLTVPSMVIVVGAELILIILSCCRGAILFAFMLLPFECLYTMMKTENKKLFLLSVSVSFIVFVLFILVGIDELNGIVGYIFERGMNSSGRVEELYPEAVELFKSYPVFGAGWGYNVTETLSGFPQIYFFHSTFFQMLANTGIVGIVFMVYFYLWRYSSLLPQIKKPSAVAATLAIFVFDAYSMIDTSIFNPAMFSILAAISVAIDLDAPENRSLAFFGKDPVKAIKKLFKK